MKHKILDFVAVVLTALLPSVAMAQHFEVGGIVYGITSEQTVEVLPYHYLLNNAYSGAITIPQTVDYGGTTYTVTALGDLAFESCTGVNSLTLPKTIRSMGAYCFYNCQFTALQLPDSLRSIGEHCFLYSYITSLHLPANFKDYDEASFWARNLTSITVDDANPYYRSIGGWLYSKDSTTLCIVPDGKGGTISVPSFVRHIGFQAFGFNSHASSVSLPEGLTSIGDFAFNCCSAVNNVVIPSTVTSIGLCPFSYCPQLSNLSIANGNTHYVMDGLMLYSSGYDTLISCHKSGATVTVNPNVKVLGGFENNTWLRNIDIPSGVTDILDNCFNGCSFTTITLPPNLKTTGSFAFANNSRLVSLIMPGTLQAMGEKVFSQSDPDFIKFTGSNPPAVTGAGPLDGIGNLDRITVPCGSMDAWLEDSYWGQFADKYVEDCGGIGDAEENAVSVYSVGGRIVIEGAECESVRVFDMTGRKVFNSEIRNTKFEILNSQFPTGVYLVKVGNHPARKVVVMK